MRILIAEDELALASALVKIFEKNNYSAEAVHDGQDALDYLLVGNYDAAIRYCPDASRSSKTGGHGIGLSIAKAICDRHGAKIHAQKQGDVISIQAVFPM